MFLCHVYNPGTFSLSLSLYVCVRMFMMHIHDEVHTSSSNGSLVITIKPEVFFFFRMTTTLLLGTFAKRLLTSSRSSARSPAFISAAPTKWISVKFDMESFHVNLPRKFKFG